VLAEVAARVQAVVRSADIPCRVGGDEFGVIMPETALDDAEHLANRIARAVAEHPVGQGHTLYASAGVAELRRDDDATALFERAVEAVAGATERLLGELVTNAAPRDREIEAERRRARAAVRFGQVA